MSLLTDKDYAEWRESYSKYGMMNEAMARAAFKAAEATVIAKLATVSVEPHEYVWEPDGTFNIGQERCLSPKTGPCHGWNIYPVYTATAIAAARAQALEEAAKRMEGPNNNHGAVIRALIGCKDD